MLENTQKELYQQSPRKIIHIHSSTEKRKNQSITNINSFKEKKTNREKTKD